MSEAVEAVVVAVEPGGWLAEHQRAHCDRTSALTSYQGLLNDEIVLPQSAADAKDPTQLVLACNAFVEALQDQIHLIPGEFAPEALWSYCAHDYVSTALNSGHAHYWAMRGDDPIALRAAAAGLKSMLADPHLATFNLMLRLKRANVREAKRIAVDAGYRDAAVAFRDLDRRLVDLEREEPIAPRHKMWLMSFRKLKLAPDAEMTQHLQRIASANALYPQRRVEAQRERAERQSSDPGFKSVATLCEMARLKPVAMSPGAPLELRKIWPEGPDKRGFGFRVETDRGPRAALFYLDGAVFKRRLAVLVQPGEALPLGSLTLSRAEYDAIVPAERG